jgi:replicative DNA helicase
MIMANEDMTDGGQRSARPTRPRRRRNTEPNTDRLPPHSPEAEQGVIGCCLLAPEDCVDQAAEYFRGHIAVFYDLRHQAIYNALLAMREAQTAIDVITLQQVLKEWNQLEEIGGLSYLSSLPDTVPSAANVSDYLAIVWEKYLLRRLVHYCTEAVGRVYEHEGEPDALFDEVERDLLAINETRLPSTARSAKDAVVRAMDAIGEFRRGVKRSVGPSMGFNYLDNIIPGMAPGDFIILAARPSTGKSAMAMQICEHVAGKLGLPTVFFSLEMTEQSLLMRQIFTRAGANLMKFNNGFLENRSLPDIVDAATAISKMPIYYDESPDLSIEDLEVKLRRMARMQGIKFAVIDYFQLLHARRRQSQWSKTDEMAHISKRIKILAKELAIPILVLCQMNRDIEKDFQRKPRLSDLKDTGQLEQDADIIIFLWRPETVRERWEQKLNRIFATLDVPEEWKHWDSHTDTTGVKWRPWREYLSIVTATVAKQRNGPSEKDSTLVFVKEWIRLVDAYARTRRKEDEEEAADSGAPAPPPEGEAAPAHGEII